MERKAQEFANEAYKELCSQYGDLVYRSKMMAKDLELLERQLAEINAAVPRMVSVENAFLVQLEKDRNTAFAAEKAAQRMISEKAEYPPPVQKLTNVTNLVDPDGKK